MLQTHFYIVTPSYNQAEFLGQTIDSVLSQAGEHSLHYCVMDGGSTDGTREVLEQYGNRFYWQSKQDNGQTDAINSGIEYLTQQWQEATRKSKEPTQHILAYLNSDDYYLPEAFNQVARAFAQHPEKQWVVGDAVIVNEHGREIQKPVRLYKQFWRMVYSNHVLSLLNPIPQPATFIRFEAADAVGCFTESLRYVMDYEYWHRMQVQFGSPHMLSAQLAGFRIHSSSKGGSQFEQQFSEELQVARAYAQNSWAPYIHQFHNLLITSVYRMIK